MNHPNALRRVDPANLRTFISEVLQAMETPPDDASFIATVLVEADLRGVDSHGATRLPGYVGMIDNAVANPLPDIKQVIDAGACAVFDGDGAFGMLVARQGMETAIDKAKVHGLGMAVSRNMTHTGLVGYYTMMAAAEGFVGIAMNNGPTIVPAFGGTTPLYATNPLSVAFPGGEEEPIVLDMATSMVAAGWLRLMEKNGEKIPTTWGLDRDGQATDDPTEVLQHGYLQWAGGYKGFGLATMIEILTGVLSGGLFGLDSPPLKHFGRDPLVQSGAYIAIDVSRFMPLAEFRERTDRLVRMIHSSKTVPGIDRVYASGELEFEKKRERGANGIPLSEPVYRELGVLSERFGVALNI